MGTISLWVQNLKQALRNLRSHGWQAGISAMGLAVGIVCLTFSLNWLWTETNYDYFRPGYKDLYLVQYNDSTRWTVSVVYNVAVQMDSLLEGKAEVGVVGMTSGIQVYPSGRKEDYFRASSLAASSGMVRALGLTVLSGDPEKALAMPGHVVLTESLARKIFGRTDAVGQTFETSGYGVDGTQAVGAVVADNEGRTFREYDMLSPLNVQESEREWNAFGLYMVYVRTEEPRVVEEAFSRIYLPQEKSYWKFRLIPLRTAHKVGYGESFLHAYFYPLAFTMISVLLLWSAVVNLLAVYTSVFLGRVREYALRRSLGASAWQNAVWMLTEVMPVALSGILLGCVALEWLAHEGQVPGNLSHVYVCFAQVVGTVFVLVVAGTGYPVHKVRRAYRLTLSGGASAGRSHAWLLVVQCFASAFLLFISLGMQRQLSGMMNQDLGFEREDILRLHTGRKYWPGEEEPFNFKSIFYDLPQEFRKEAAAGITDAIALPADIFNRFSRRRINLLTEEEWNGKKDDRLTPENEIDYMEVPYAAFDFFHLRMARGARLEEQPEQDGVEPVMFNEAACRKFRAGDFRKVNLYVGSDDTGHNVMWYYSTWTNHIAGKLEVKGIMDVRLSDFHEEERPLMWVGIPDRHECRFVEHDAVYVKHAPGRREDAEAAIRRVLRRFDVPEDKIHLMPLERYMADSYKEETYYAGLLSALTVFSVLVTFSGVFSMLLYSLLLRRRSMAIRRVMGAGFRDVFRPQLWSYLLYVVAGGVLAYFPAALLMRKWMEYFHYGETPGVGLMAAIVCGLCVVVSLIVYGQVRRCMNDKPVEVLRPES
ncbi:ABC transporter permease [Paraprevotella xylaniphila]|uniref:ABC transporter permease n=1 Tax=Paraprevotella xylaniphila TaxID=454155 RepID=UPI0030780194